MAHRLAPEAEAEVDDISYYITKESHSIEVADRVIDSITNRFFLLAIYPHLGRHRDEDLRPGLRSFLVGEYVIIYRIEAEDVLILHVMRGSDLDMPGSCSNGGNPASISRGHLHVIGQGAAVPGQGCYWPSPVSLPEIGSK